ncbi:hypothetical protein SLEP1_g20910 [Rubroshorea leprosula]|uniref:Uncharacterized protein n=1 Tax=Rubroshorea leprosula TaxID=152421 RepID=A0AAV5J7F9_9ROSI|nr:hypothetical protein SLEP1_g20910 [Rubroshorea leprosula]
MKQISKTSTVGIIITIVLAIFMSKYGPSFKIKKEVETAVETAGQVTDVVEKLAGDVANLAGLVADQLPEDGQVKDFVTDVQNIAKVAADDADLVGDVIENVGRVKKEIETAETAEQVVDIVGNLAEEVNVTKEESDQLPEGERVKNPGTVDDDVAEEAIHKSPAVEEAIEKVHLTTYFPLSIYYLEVNISYNF